MRLSDVSIQRPVLATVMNLLVLVVGAVAFLALPVREFPDVEGTLVSVSTRYRGASPETVESTITEPIEQVLNGIEGMRSIDSAERVRKQRDQRRVPGGPRHRRRRHRRVECTCAPSTGCPRTRRRPVIRKAGAIRFPSCG